MMATRTRRKQEFRSPGETSTASAASCLVIEPMASVLESEQPDAEIVVSDEGMVVITEQMCEEIVADGFTYEQDLGDGSVTYVTQEGEEESGIQYVAIAAEEEVGEIEEASKIEDIMAVVNSAVDVYKRSRHAEVSTSDEKYYIGFNPDHRGISHKQRHKWRLQEHSFNRPATISSKSHVIRHFETQHQVEEEDRDTSDADENEDDTDANDYRQLKRQRRYNRKPKKRDYAHRLQWSPDSMRVALDAVNIQKMTIRGAAKKFAVPYSTLKDRVNGRVQHGVKPGVKTVLSPEEEVELEECVKRIKDCGFQLHCIDIRERARELLILNRGSNTPYQEVVPGHNWLSGFFKRHRGIEIRRAQNRNVAPSAAKQKQIVKSFFDVAQKMYAGMAKNSLPHRLYTLCEIPLGAYTGSKILLAGAADGSFLPPFVVFRGPRAVAPAQLQQLCPDSRFYASPTGRVTADVLLMWFRDHFLRRIRPAHGRGVAQSQPAILLMCQPIANISVRLMQLAEAEQVQFVCIPLGISHLVQPITEPMIVGIDSAITFRSTKLTEAGENAMTQQSLARILGKVWRKDLPIEDLKRNFAENGLLPLNPRAISMERIMSTTIPTSALANMSNQDEADEYIDEDEPQNGLTLLSELSSHEYSAMYDAMGASGPPRSITSVEKLDSPDKNEAASNDRHMRGKRRRLCESPVSSCSSSPVKAMVSNESTPRKVIGSAYSLLEQPLSSSSPGKALSFSDRIGGRVGILHHRKLASEIGRKIGTVESQRTVAGNLAASTSSCSRTRPSAYEARIASSDIHSEIAAARNSDQISLAINSIMDLPTNTDAGNSDRLSQRQPAISVRGTAFSRLSPDAYPIRINSLQLQQYARSSSGTGRLSPSAPKKFITLNPVHRGDMKHIVEQTSEYIIEEVPQDDITEQKTIDMESEGYEQGGYKEEVVEEEVVGESATAEDPDGAEEVYQSGIEDLKAESCGDIAEAAAAPIIRLSDLRSQLDPDQPIRVVKSMVIDGQSVKVYETSTLRQLWGVGENKETAATTEVDGEEQMAAVEEDSEDDQVDVGITVEEERIIQ